MCIRYPLGDHVKHCSFHPLRHMYLTSADKRFGGSEHYDPYFSRTDLAHVLIIRDI
jgi:hypothetical protein